jgi:hypothetical protein
MCASYLNNSAEQHYLYECIVICIGGIFNNILFISFVYKMAKIYYYSFKNLKMCTYCMLHTFPKIAVMS